MVQPQTGSPEALAQDEGELGSIESGDSLPLFQK